MSDAQDRVLRFDMQESERLFSGWADDPKYGTGKGLDALIGKRALDVVIGGPPCQAYSIAGRIRDENGMRDDYRNYLFESYLNVIRRYRPKAFIFENVPGLLSAKPDGTPIVDRIRSAFEEAGWVIPDDLRLAQVDMSEYGLPQKRKRIILLGLSKDYFGENAVELLNRFYNELLPTYKRRRMSVGEAIGDLPRLLPLRDSVDKKISHALAETRNCPSDHEPRFHNARDTAVFQMLAEDIRESVRNFVSMG